MLWMWMIDVQAPNTDCETELHKNWNWFFKSDWLITMLSTKMLIQEHVALGKIRFCWHLHACTGFINMNMLKTHTTGSVRMIHPEGVFKNYLNLWTFFRFNHSGFEIWLIYSSHRHCAQSFPSNLHLICFWHFNKWRGAGCKWDVTRWEVISAVCWKQRARAGLTHSPANGSRNAASLREF